MMLEVELQQAALDLAGYNGWLSHHTRPARTADGSWRTPLQGDAGFVDVLFAHPRHGVVFAEFKSERGRLSPGQSHWRTTLVAATWRHRARYKLWRPSNWDDIEQTLHVGRGSR